MSINCNTCQITFVYQVQHSISCLSIALPVKRFCLSSATTLQRLSIKCITFKICLSSATLVHIFLSSAMQLDKACLSSATVSILVSIKWHGMVLVFYQVQCCKKLSIMCYTLCLSCATLQILSCAIPCFLSSATFPFPFQTWIFGTCQRSFLR